MTECCTDDVPGLHIYTQEKRRNNTQDFSQGHQCGLLDEIIANYGKYTK